MPTCPDCHERFDDDVVACPNDGASLLDDAAFASADVDLKPGDKVGEYEVVGKLGQGGFGAVFRAVQPLIGKNVAIKVLKRQFSSDPQMASRFISEARAVNQIGHRFIIDVFSFGQLDDGRHYYVMSLLDGKPLDALMKERGGALPVSEALPILKMIAEAVDAAHAAGVAHRDLKPENVFVCSDGTVKLLDFGIAKLSGDDVKHKTQTGAAMGTAVYMSPEQARGRNVDHRTDIYAFGAMTFHMLTGELPFWGTDFMDILMKQVAEPPPAPSARSSSVDTVLDAPVLAMLEKNPDRRPQTMTDAVNGLRHALGEDVPAPAPPPPVREVAETLPSTPGVDTVATTPATPNAVGAIADTAPPVNTPPKRPMWMVAAGIGVVAAGIAAVVALRGGNDDAGAASAPPPAPTIDAAVVATAPPPDAAAVAPPPDAAPATVTLTIVDAPAGTEVTGPDGTVLGNVPGTIDMPRGDAPVDLTFRRKRYDDLTLPVTPDTAKTVSAKLTRTTRKRPTESKPDKPKGFTVDDLPDNPEDIR